MPAAYSTDIRGWVIASVESWVLRDARQRRSLDVRSKLRDQMGCDLPNDWKLGRPSRGAGAPRHWRSTRTFC